MKAVVVVSTIFAKAIKGATENGILGGMPAGELYVRVMGYMSLDTFESIIGLLVSNGLVSRDHSHLLRWIGAKKEKEKEKEQVALTE